VAKLTTITKKRKLWIYYNYQDMAGNKFEAGTYAEDQIPVEIATMLLNSSQAEWVDDNAPDSSE
jgi:hypothetical protein